MSTLTRTGERRYTRYWLKLEEAIPYILEVGRSTEGMTLAAAMDDL